jgi:hypothetical protein
VDGNKLLHGSHFSRVGSAPACGTEGQIFTTPMHKQVFFFAKIALELMFKYFDHQVTNTSSYICFIWDGL